MTKKTSKQKDTKKQTTKKPIKPEIVSGSDRWKEKTESNTRRQYR